MRESSLEKPIYCGDISNMGNMGNIGNIGNMGNIGSMGVLHLLHHALLVVVQRVELEARGLRAHPLLAGLGRAKVRDAVEKRWTWNKKWQ